MQRIKVLRDYNAQGYGSGVAGEEKEISDEAFAYLVAYDEKEPLIEAADKKKGSKE